MSAAERDEILRAIRALPPRERLRLVEQVVHDLAAEGGPAGGGESGAVIGMFDGDEGAFDEVVEGALSARERDPLRRPDA